jgi:hypothetical protein
MKDNPQKIKKEFEKDIYIESEYQQAHIRFIKDDDGNMYGILCDIDEQQIGKRNYFIHEIENLYFALTGKELQIDLG